MLRINETPKSRSGTSDPPTQVREYLARGEFDENYVRAAAYAQTPAFIAVPEGILFRQDISLEPAGYCLYRITVPYDRRKRETGSFTFSFDTTGGTTHVNASKQTVKIYDEDDPNGTVSPTLHGKHNYKNLIGFNGEDVAGVDVVIPAGKFTVEFKHPLGIVDDAYMVYVQDLAGIVNSTRLFHSEPGEVLFLGATGSDGTQSEAVLNYHFWREKNVVDQVVGDYTISKKGWEYAWIRYKSTVTGTLPGKIPEAVIVERLYDEDDLAGLLGFGGSPPPEEED